MFLSCQSQILRVIVFYHSFAASIAQKPTDSMYLFCLLSCLAHRNARNLMKANIASGMEIAIRTTG